LEYEDDLRFCLKPDGQNRPLSRQRTGFEPSVVIFSAFGNEYLAQAIEAGATGYILKTATQSEMVLAVVQAADGQCPLDPRLIPRLFDRLTQLSSKRRGSVLSSRHQNPLTPTNNLLIASDS